MKRFLQITLALLILTGIAYGAALKPYAFPFIGRWQPSEDPLLIDDFGLQDIQNMRRNGKHLEGISGDTKVNTTTINATYSFPKNLFHFSKDNPYQESHVMALMTNEAHSGGTIYKNDTAIPDAGDFSGASVWLDTPGAGLGRFSKAPGGRMAYANGKENIIWGGSEIAPILFIVSASAVTDDFTLPKDYSTEVINVLDGAGNIASIGGGNDSGAKLLLQFDGANLSTAYIDGASGSTGSPHTVSGSTAAVISSEQIKFGTASGKFEGGSSVFIADHPDWALNDESGATLFTIDFWAWLDPNGTDAPLFQQYVSKSEKVTFWGENRGDAVFDVWHFNVESSGTSISFQFTANKDASRWLHFAIIKGWDSDSTKIAITIDGQMRQAITTSNDWPDVAAQLELGRATLQSGSSLFLTGFIDEFRWTKGIARWTANFTPPTAAFNANDDRSWVIGSPVPISGASFYLSSTNTTSGQTITGREWNGASWSTLSLTDGTNGLANSGKITWPATTETARVKYLYGFLLYWYSFTITAGEASISNVTLDAPLQEVRDIWDGEPLSPGIFQINRSGAWTDYSDEVVVPSSPSAPIGAEMGGVSGPPDHAIVMFSDQVTAIQIFMLSGNTVAQSSGTSIYYWNGTKYVLASNIYDTTVEGSDPLGRSGYLAWQAPDRAQEFAQNLFGFQGYAYKIAWNLTLDSTGDKDGTLIDLIEGTPAQGRIDPVDFPFFYQNRLFLAKGNKLRYSSENTAHIWNGSDTGDLFVGDELNLTAAGVIYNLFRTSSFEQVILTKSNATFRLFGNGPESWVIQQISEDTGAIAPLSMAVGAFIDENQQPRNIAIYQADRGVVICDGTPPRLISQDIEDYFDPESESGITTSMLDDSVGWYDPDLQAYKLLIAASGSSILNTELEYSFLYREWTKIHRHDSGVTRPLQVGTQVKDAKGKAYSYGMADNGTMYRLEAGNSFDGSAITQFVRTKDILLDDQGKPFFNFTTVENMRLMFKPKSGASPLNNIRVSHWGDGLKTVTGTSNETVPNSIDINSTLNNGRDSQSPRLGPNLKHSFRFESAVTDVLRGMELHGLGLYFKSFDNWRP